MKIKKPARPGGLRGFDSLGALSMNNETLKNIGEIVDRINSLKTQLEDLVSDLYDSDVEYALLNYIDSLDSAESELASEVTLPNCEWMQ